MRSALFQIATGVRQIGAALVGASFTLFFVDSSVARICLAAAFLVYVLGILGQAFTVGEDT